MLTINLAILGLGRIGASFGLALKHYAQTPGAQYQFTIVGYDSSVERLQAARKLEAIDQAARTPAAAVAKPEMILVAVPPGLYDDLYAAFGSEVRPGSVVLDFSPLKQSALTRAKKHLPHDAQNNPQAYIVGATAVLSPAVLFDWDEDTAAASADLFDKGALILAPAADCHPEAVQLASDFGALLGMAVRFVDPLEHDGLITVMDGLPLLIALGLYQTASRSGSWDDLRRMGNPAFALATLGLGQYAPDDAAAFFSGNRERAVQALESLIKTLTTLRDVLQDDDSNLLEANFNQAIAHRDQWLSNRLKDEWDSKTDIKPTENISLMGVLGARFSFRGLRPGENKADDKR